MKFLHTSDWHLGKLFFEHSLYEDQEHFLHQVAQELLTESQRGEPYDALLIPGDIYDRGVPPAEATALFSHFLTTVHAQLPDLHIFLLSGNHDNAERLSFVKELLAAHNIHICTDCAHIAQPVVINDTAVYQLPYLHAGDIDYDQNGNRLAVPLKTQQELYAEAVAIIRKTHDSQYKDKQSILCAHLFAAGSVKSDSERVSVGTAEQVDASLFSSFSYVALGHLHSNQKAAHNAMYAGSPLCYSFDERKNPKCMIKGALVNNKLCLDSIPFKPLHECVEITDTFENLQHKSEYSAYEDCYVSIVCTDDTTVMDPVPSLRKRFTFLLSFRYERVARTSTVSLDKRRELLTNTSSASLIDIFDSYIADIHDGQQFENSALVQKEHDLFVSYCQKLTQESSE